MIELRNRLIVDYSSLKEVSKIVGSAQNEIILVFFTLAILFEFFGEWNFGKVFKRLVYCFIVLIVFGPILKTAIDLSFEVSNKILNQCKNTEFCSHYLTLTRSKVQDATLWSETVDLIKNFSSFWLHSLVSLIFKLAFVFTIQIYSLVYSLTIITYPLVCSIGILPVPGEGAFVGIFQSILWLFLSPIVLSIVIVLLASVTNVGIGPRGEVGLEGLLHLMVLSLFSLGSLFLSWALCKGQGVASFGSSLSQMGTTVLAMSGINSMTQMSKELGGSSHELASMGSSLGKNKLKNYVSSSVNSGLSNKGLKLSKEEIAKSNNSLLGSPIIPKGSEAYNSLSPKEKFIHSVDSIVNSKENSQAKLRAVRDFKNVTNSSHGQTKLPIAQYKIPQQRSSNSLSTGYKNNQLVRPSVSNNQNSVKPNSNNQIVKGESGNKKIVTKTARPLNKIPNSINDKRIE